MTNFIVYTEMSLDSMIPLLNYNFRTVYAQLVLSVYWIF